ncbi:hypothetical protein [Brachybacterium sacelli]|uniref:Uncharacterized protein n=1 Tax=Brachybacterium sacelli TaxID=173364 RepID=A0ABS4WVU9_9MICO|nr:hypothetical protein [Brachybacterium sacelli]MBP2380329.1 hypothetical protein [Brachybacterium sacelli]
MSSRLTPLRLVRGAVAATLTTTVALGGHLVGGEAVPSWIAVALPWWLSIIVCTLLAGGCFTLSRMALAVLASQAIFHGMFRAGSSSGSPFLMADPPGPHAGHGDAWMTLWHVLAALLTAVLLHHGESTLFRCFGAARRLLSALRRPVDVRIPLRRPASTGRPAIPSLTHLLHAQRAVLTPQLRRGPPPPVAPAT